MRTTQQNQTSDINDPLDVWRAYIRILQELKDTYPGEYQRVPEILKRYAPDDIRNLTDEEIRTLRELNAIPENGPPPVTMDDIRNARAYLHTLAKLIGSTEFRKIPPVPAILIEEKEAIDYLDAPKLQALLMMNVFPAAMFPQRSPQISTEDQDAMKLDQALSEYCNQDPELRKLIHDPALFQNPNKAVEFTNHPKIQMFFMTHPDLKAIRDRMTEKTMNQRRQAAGWPARATTSPPSGPYRSHPYGTPDPEQTQTQFPGSQSPFPNALSPKAQRDIAKATAQIAEMYTEGAAALMDASFKMNNKMGEAFRKAGG